jgi:putative peptidoglycan lipid II flippase
MILQKLTLAFVSSILGKLFGFLRVQGIVVVLGATAMADALLVCLNVISFFDATLLSGGAMLLMQSAYIRRQVRLANGTALTRFANSMALWAYCAAGFGAALVILAHPITMLVAPGFGAEARAGLVSLIRVGAAIPLATTLMTFVSTLNRVAGREVLFTVNPVVINGLSLLAIYVSANAGAGALGVAQWLLVTVLLSTLGMTAFQARFLDGALRTRGTVLLLRALWPRHVRRRVRMHGKELLNVMPLVSSLVAQQVIVFISYGFASRSGDGAVAVVGVAERLTSVVFVLFVATFLTILEPRWARALAGGGQAIRSLNDDLGVIFICLIPATCTLVFAGGELATLLFAHGELSGNAALQLGAAASVYGAALPGISLALIYGRLLAMAGMAGKLFSINAAAVVLHLALCMALSPVFGLLAIPASVAITLSVQAAWYRFILGRTVGLGAGAVRSRLRMLLVAASCAGVSYIVGLLPLARGAKVVFVGLTGVVTALVVAQLVGIGMVQALRRMGQAQ